MGVSTHERDSTALERAARLDAYRCIGDGSDTVTDHLEHFAVLHRGVAVTDHTEDCAIVRADNCTVIGQGNTRTVLSTADQGHGLDRDEMHIPVQVASGQSLIRCEGRRQDLAEAMPCTSTSENESVRGGDVVSHDRFLVGCWLRLTASSGSAVRCDN